ncbi:4Fe-4S binding protein [Nocardioides sp.]|uniref:4Fe-4S binding protein n=1 Tax=Nocardioides sp. TaxID=35761 RepID=UPI002B2793E6|nr:4Fe-4S binding protein [Nocardioides sp.]
MTAFAITQSCCSDASCVSVCPVNCIHPAPGEPDFGLTDMLYIDPRSCIGCGACADACPVDAIFPVDALLRGAAAEYVDLNRAHFTDAEPQDDWDEPVFPATLAPHATGLRVAIVGTGPAASYAAAALCTTGAEVTMIDRLPVPGGLIRFGVAPDHQSTKAIASRFATVLRNPRLDLVLDLEVGTHVSHDDLLEHHDAVVYAVGAAADRRLDVPGEDLVGSLPARTFVGWYNAHPEVAADAVDLGPRAQGRAVIIGNGNVALDMARILLSDADGPQGLATTDIADHALVALRQGSVSEVVLVARRGPDAAAYSLSELRPLLAREDVEVVIDGGPDVAAAIAGAEAGSKTAALRGVPVSSVDWSVSPDPARRRLVLRFDSTVDRLEAGSDAGDRVGAVVLDAGAARVPTGLVLRSVGYRSEPLAGLPFDDVIHTVPHEQGRVIDPSWGEPVPASYVVGWIKRGPRGGIGSNRADAAETVAALVEDANERRITTGRGSSRSFRRLVRERRSEPLSRPRVVKLATLEDLVGTARGR